MGLFIYTIGTGSAGSIARRALYISGINIYNIYNSIGRRGGLYQPFLVRIARINAFKASFVHWSDCIDLYYEPHLVIILPWLS